jgi:hypothetical protein
MTGWKPIPLGLEDFGLLFGGQFGSGVAGVDDEFGPLGEFVDVEAIVPS